MANVIEAAGGLVCRTTSKGTVKVLLVHRPRYDDWSFPKGKLESGEDHESAARREVEEETGLRCRLRDELREVRYRDRKGRSKRVRYWLMEPVDGSFEPSDEVDAVRWVPLGAAGAELTYRHDAELLVEVAARL